MMNTSRPLNHLLMFTCVHHQLLQLHQSSADVHTCVHVRMTHAACVISSCAVVYALVHALGPHLAACATLPDCLAAGP